MNKIIPILPKVFQVFEEQGKPSWTLLIHTNFIFKVVLHVCIMHSDHLPAPLTSLPSLWTLPILSPDLWHWVSSHDLFILTRGSLVWPLDGTIHWSLAWSPMGSQLKAMAPSLPWTISRKQLNNREQNRMSLSSILPGDGPFLCSVRFVVLRSVQCPMAAYHYHSPSWGPRHCFSTFSFVIFPRPLRGWYKCQF